MLDIVSDNWDHVDVNSTKSLAIQKQIIENAAGQETVIIKYTFNRSGTFFITDIFGHEILLDESMDGDTIDLKLTRTKPLAKNSAGRSGDYLNDSISSTKFYVIDYPDKYKYMGFFDSLAYIHGDLHAGGGNYSFKQLEHNIALYLSLVNKVYADRVKFYRDFIHRYNMPALDDHHVPVPQQCGDLLGLEGSRVFMPAERPLRRHQIVQMAHQRADAVNAVDIRQVAASFS